MLKSRFLFLLLIVCLPLPALSKVFSWKDLLDKVDRSITSHQKKYQFWHKQSLQTHMTRGMAVQCEMKYGFASQGWGLFYKHYQGRIIQRLPLLTLGLGYRYVDQLYQNVAEKKWQNRHIPLADVTVTLGGRICSLQNRCRLLYQIRSKDHMQMIYCNRTRVTLPWVIPALRWPIYLFDELFIGKDRKVHENRCGAGIICSLGRHIQIHLAYQYRMEKQLNEEWDRCNLFSLYMYSSF